MGLIFVFEWVAAWADVLCFGLWLLDVGSIRGDLSYGLF